MKKIFFGTVLAVVFLTICVSACSPRELAKGQKEKIEQFLRNVVADTMEEDYRRHDMFIKVRVTQLTMDRISIDETKEDVGYFVEGRVSYIIKGKRKWLDREENIIQLGPEQEITHWFSCGVLEDKYMGVLLRDKKNHLTYYAEKPMQQ